MSLDPATLDIFRENGRAIARIRHQLVEYAQNNASLEAIDAEAERLIRQFGGEPAFKKVSGYHWTTCLCLNDCLVHGIPKGTTKPGDILTIDVGMSYKNTTTDVATTIVIGEASEAQKYFLAIGKKALRKAIAKAQPGNKVKDISKQLQRIPEKAGYSVTRDLVGHGLGRTMHEPPQIPCYVSSDSSMRVRLRPGMVITIEAMYMQGDWPLTTDSDGWGMRTKDGSLSAMFEEDIIITEQGPEVISSL